MSIYIYIYVYTGSMMAPKSLMAKGNKYTM